MKNTTLGLDIVYENFWKMKDFRIFRSETTNNLYAFGINELYESHNSNGKWTTYQLKINELKGFELRKVFPLGIDIDLLIFTSAIGIIVILSYSYGNLQLISQHCEFPDHSIITDIAFGRFFNNSNGIGLMISKSNLQFAFYELIEDKCKSIQFTNFALQCPNSTKLEIVHLRKQQVKDAILCWNNIGLNAFEFNEMKILHWIMSIRLIGGEKLFFPSLTQHDKWNDLVIFNSTGMFVFQLHDIDSYINYQLINYNPMFSKIKGWSDEHTATVQFEDVNNDGNDDLIFTGPNGINILSFNVYTNKWKSLLNTEMLRPHERYATILYVQPIIPNYTNAAMIILNLANHYYVGNVIEIEVETIRFPSSINEKFPVFEVSNRDSIIASNEAQLEAKQSTIYLRDQNIWSNQWVNTKTGKASFVLPLVGGVDASATIEFNLLYDGGYNINKYLTDGWSVEETYIISIFEASNFKEDEILFFVRNSVPYKMIFSQELSNANYKIYLLDSTNRNEENVRVKLNLFNYDLEADIGTSHKQYFGGDRNSINTDYLCRNWRTRCIDDDLNEKWFIIYLKYETFANITRTYEYDRFLIDHESVVYLKKISDSDNSSEIEFSYKRRYNDYDMEILSGNLRINPLYLVGYHYKTKTKEQKVQFNYSLMGNSLVLTAIEQIPDYVVDNPVMKFSYSKQRNGKYALQKILLPTGVEIVYEYKRLGELRGILELSSKTFPIPDDVFNVSYGPDFILISYLEDNDVVLRMFKNDFSEELYSSILRSYPTKGVWPLLQGGIDNVKLFEVFLANSFLAIVLYSLERRQIHLFGQLNDGSWQTKQTSYENNKDAIILKGNDFLLISDPASWVSLIEWSSTENKFIRTELLQNSRGSSAAVYGNHFVLYDNDHLYNGFKPLGSNKYILKNLKRIPYVLSRTENLLTHRLQTEWPSSTFQFFRNNALQLYQNLIVLSELIVIDHDDGQQLATNITTFLIDNYHDLVTEQNILIEQDMIESVRVNSKSFDLKNYHILLNGGKFSCRNISYFFGGAKWYPFENINFNNYSLGNEYVLSKLNNESTIKLFEKKGNRFVFDIGVNFTHELRINYPHYIAAQAEGKPIKLIQFNRTATEGAAAITNVTLPVTQTLTVFGNVDTFVVSDTNSEGRRNLIIWYKIAVEEFLTTNHLVESMKVVIPGEAGAAGPVQRITGYGYNVSSMRLFKNIISYDQTFVYPGNDASEYGYIRYTGESVEFFNDANELVKPQEDKNNVDKDNEKASDQNEKNEILFDESGLLEIADFSPFNITSGMVGFDGFEDYEIQNVKFKLVKGKYSLTGRNYLHLNNESVKRIFTPEIQDQQFVVSSWIRIPFENLPELGDIVPYLRAKVLTESGQEVGNFLSHIKYRLENWSYLEIIVDLQFIRYMLRDNIQLEPKNLKIELRISPSTQFPIDVDNVRFSPLNHIFEVNVYDINRSRPVAVIKSSGAIVRHLYDKYGVRIAEINESNQIREFVTYTKGSHEGLGGRANPRCAIKLIPEMAFYENFSPNSFLKQWSFEDYQSWSISPGTLQHHSNRSDSLSVKNAGIEENSCGIRFLYSLQNDSLLVLGNLIELERNSYGGKLSFNYNYEMGKRRIPIEGELLIVKEGERVFVWIDGDLYFDRRTLPIKTFEFLVQGEVRLQHLMVFSRPQVHVIYKNALNEDIQQISLTSMDSVVVKELLYDEVGRQRITVQPVEVTRQPEESILSYAADLVTNDDPSEINSVWRTGELEGKINRILGHPFGFSEIVFEKNPLNVKSRIGMPGKIFSSSGNYAQRFNSTTANSFLLERYPPRWNFTYHVQSKISFDEISIYNKENLKVASYIDVEGSRDLFSTFEYNEKGFLVKYLPPMYYNDFGSFDRETHDLTYVPQFNELQEQRLATCISYNDGGHLTRKTTPDTGLVENVYDDDGGKQLRFRIQYSRKNPSDIEAITYLAYDEFGRLVSRGNLREPFPSNQLLKLNISEANAEEYQRFHYSDLERDTAFWGKVLRTITKSQNEELFEESILDAEGNVISKRYVIPTGTDQPMILAINQRFRGGQLQEIMYPASMFGEPFRVAYQYDKLGRMVSVGVPGQPQRFLAITYNANDQVLSETFSPLRQHWFTRNYTYNEPGFPIEIDDPFLRQELSYTDRGYGKHGYADGTVSRTKYTAKWHNSASRYGLGVRSNHQLPPLCYDGLKSEGYLDDNDQQTRIFYQDLEFKLPPACTQDATSADIKRVLGKYGFPKEYGFRFDYGNLMELTKAKYFVGNIPQESKPLLHDTFFEEIQNVDKKASQNIWSLLLEWGFISQENGHGKVNKYFLDEILNLSDLGNHEFSTIFKDKRPLIPEIVRLLQKYSATELGQAEFDVQSYEIDANGNHKRFFAGFEHYQLKYEPNSNRIAEVRHQNTADGQDAKVFKMRHDSRGNVVQALHKNIESMEYHPVSNRLQKVTMSDGTTITLQYDARGERVLKRVTNENGLITFETHYLRDENSRSLVERQVTFMAPDQNPDVLVTMYIYGPNGLIGFVRRDQFYSVISDHLGSVRLVVRDGEVVAAYDYMPYGNLMRIYGHNPDAHISYRFNGQEWDPEFRLYNYHARFYDPVIGRFYQMDPSSQYFSPYKYAGNSPISMVDPSGEVSVLFILAVAGFALLGGYLGGASTNANFNPLAWKRDYHTAFAILGGIGSGAFFPYTLAALTSITSIALATSFGLFTAYLGAAATNGEWDPRQWDYSTPATYNAILQGFITGAGVIVAYPKIWSEFKKLNHLSQFAFLSASTSFGGLGLVMAGVKTNWDMTSPEFWYASLISILSATDYPMKVNGGIKYYVKQKKAVLENLSLMKKSLIFTKNHSLYVISKNIAKIAIGIAGYAIYLTMVAMIDTNFLPWSSTQAATLHNYLQLLIFAGFVVKKMKRNRQIHPQDRIVSVEMHDFARQLRPKFQQMNYNTIRYRRSIGELELNDFPQTDSNDIEFHINKKSINVQFPHIALIFTLNRFLNPCFLAQKWQRETMLMENLTSAISRAKEKIVSEYVGSEMFAKSVAEKISYETTVDHKTSDSLEGHVENFVLQISYLDRDLIESKIVEMHLETQQSLEIKQKYHEIESEIANNQDLVERNLLGKLVKSLKTKEQNSITNATETIVEVIWRNLKPLQDSINSWDLKTFVDFQTPPNRTIYVRPPNQFDSFDNFYYLSMDNLKDIPDLLNFPKCSTCIAAVPKRRNKIINIEWLKLLNGNFNQLLPHFLSPSPVKRITTNETRKRSKRNILESRDTRTEMGSLKQRKHRGWFHELTKLFKGNHSEVPEKSLPHYNVPHAEETLNILEMCDTYFHHAANNGTLLFAEVLLAKCFKRKMYNSSESNVIANGMQFTKVHCLACKMIEMFENRLMTSAMECQISEGQLDMSFIPELYQEIIHLANKKRFDEIPHLMTSYSMEALHSTTSSLNAESRKQFENRFSGSTEFGKTIDEIIFNWIRLDESGKN